jgi:hypothetical protein
MSLDAARAEIPTRRAAAAEAEDKLQATQRELSVLEATLRAAKRDGAANEERAIAVGTIHESTLTLDTLSSIFETLGD